MTVYFIYKHSDGLEPYLYAITDKKDLRDSFFQERKKSMFISKKKEITKDKYTIICSRYSQYILGRKGYKTKSFSSLNDTEIVYLVSTNKEESSIIEKEDKVFLHIGQFTDEDAKYFNDEILKALDTLMYFDMYKYTNLMYNIDDYFTSGICIMPDKYKLDEFGVFLYLFGNTLDKERIIKNE